MGRSKPGKRKLEAAMLELLNSKGLQEISVSELCSYAGVSRSTFYTYYSNVGEIYRELVKSLASDTKTLKEQFKSGQDESMVLRKPFCAVIQDNRFGGLIKEEGFIQTFIDICCNGIGEEAYGIYLDVTENRNVAMMLNLFQLTGCLAVAKVGRDNPDWMLSKRAVDVFIKGGISALRGKSWNSANPIAG